MSLRVLLGDPSWLFDFAIPIRSATVVHPERLDWELEDSYQLPPLYSLLRGTQFATFSMAWSEQGLFASVKIDPNAQKPRYDFMQPRTMYGSQMRLSVFVDTRWSPDVRRGTIYCHRFDFMCDEPKGKQVQRGHGELNTLHRARVAPAAVHPKDLYAGTLAREFGNEFRAFIPAHAMTGFDPTEYQDLGIFLMATDPNYGQQTVARSIESTYGEDPSQWCRGKLI
jgi:hypothetical protein